MKVKLIIEGRRVKDVGYRAFLLSLATACNLRGFLASNVEKGVVVLAEGDERDVEEFVRMVRAERPKYAEVSKVSVEQYDGAVTPIEKYSGALMAEQLSKILQAGLEMVRKQEEGLVVAKENLKVSKGTLDVAKETLGVAKENLEVSKETRDLVRENLKVSKEARDIARETLGVARETLDVTKETRDISRETLEVTKETRDIAKETLEVAKETRDFSKEALDVSRDTRDEIKELRADFRSWLSKEVEELRAEVAELRKAVARMESRLGS